MLWDDTSEVAARHKATPTKYFIFMSGFKGSKRTAVRARLGCSGRVTFIAISIKILWLSAIASATAPVGAVPEVSVVVDQRSFLRRGSRDKDQEFSLPVVIRQGCQRRALPSCMVHSSLL